MGNLDCDEVCPNSEYYTQSEFSKLNLDNHKLFVHLNISSLSYYIDELNLLLSQMKHRPEIIAISESRIRKNKETLANINILGYNFEHTPTDAEKGGTLLYISKDLKYKIRKDLNILQTKLLESTFIEVLNKKNKKNMIIGCIYKHPVMSIPEFLTDFLNPLLQKLSFEKKRNNALRRLQHKPPQL